MSISKFLDFHYRHFNARELVAAARAWKQHTDEGARCCWRWPAR
jgi:deoxyhypusine synthase